MSKQQAREIVGGWLMQLWFDRPDWMARMPDQKDIDDLVRRITAAGK